MIVKAAVKIFDNKQEKEIIIPCHRHSDAYEILYNLNYKKNVDYYVIQEGFLDDDDNFYTRIEAKQVAIKCNQIVNSSPYTELFSEELW